MDYILSNEELQTWLTILRATTRLNRRLDVAMRREHNFRTSWYDVLVHLYHAPEQRLMMNDLAEQMIMSGSGLTRLLDRMVDRGLIAREPCAEDRRIIYAVITDVGRERLEQILPFHQERIRRYLLSQASSDELRTVRHVFQRVLEQLNAADTETE